MVTAVTRKQYAEALASFILFPFRLMSAKHDPTDPQLAKRLDKIPIKAGINVLTCLYAIIQAAEAGTLTLDDEGVTSYVPPNGWENLIHQYLYAILTDEITEQDSQIACITEQVLCFGALRIVPEDNWFGFQCANAFTIRCSALQHGLFAILVQHVRLKSSGMDKYIPYESKKSSKSSAKYAAPQTHCSDDNLLHQSATRKRRMKRRRKSERNQRLSN